MPFQKSLLGWKATGIEPPLSLKERGWEAQQKPPAPYFNWMFYLVDQALLELQKNAIHSDKIGVAGGVARLNAQGKPMNADGTPAGEVSKEDFSGHTGNAGIHTSPEEKAVWTAKETPQGAQAKINAAIAALIDGAPTALDTLKELAAAIGNDSNFAVTIANALSKKVDKVTGKQLSTEDYTTAEKSKLSGVAPGANNYVHPATHPATMIEQTPTHRMVSDTWINNMNNKETPEGAQAKVNAAIAALINGAPGALDTLNELAAAIDNDPNFAATVTNALATKETPAGAQSKATAALNVAKAYAMNIVNAGSTSVDPNTTTEGYVLTNHANSPAPSIYWHILTMFYSSTGGNRAQIAVSYNNAGTTRMMTRSTFNNVWTPWVEHLTTAQGQAQVDTHANNKTNPHAVTKAQIGLPDVPNFGVATKAEAEAGTSAVKLMTPERTKEAILKLAPPPTAEKVTITDAGNYYTGTNTEAALQEIGSNIGNKAILKTTDKNSLVAAVNELFTSASNGKAAIENAVAGIDPRVVIPANPSFAELAIAVGQIETGKKFAYGKISASTIKSMPFQNQVGGDSTAYYGISATGLSFTPKTVYIMTPNGTGGTMISNEDYMPKYLGYSIVLLSGSGTTVRLTGNAKLVSGGFTLPVFYSASGEFSWLAFE